MTRLPLSLFTIAAVLATPGAALAFSNHVRFGSGPLEVDPMTMEPAMQQGGGGGRYFTGSLLDGYTCEVCHSTRLEEGEATPIPENDFDVDGWPEDGYMPGGPPVDIVVSFPRDATAAAALEIVQEDGTGVGTLELVPNPNPQDLCPGAMPGEEYPAVNIVSLPQDRAVAVSDVCAGVLRLRARWIPPPVDEGGVWLNIAVVASPDAQSDTLGDTVFTFARLTPAIGGAVVPSDPRAGCTVSSADRAGGPLAWLALSALAWVWARRRRAGDRARPDAG